jgi:hypothetical protein
MLKLVDPILKLFTYTLKQGLGVEESETHKIYQGFLESLSEQLHEKLNVSFTSEEKRKFLELNEVEVADLSFTGNLSNHQVKRRYRRWNVSDNYNFYLMLC